MFNLDINYFAVFLTGIWSLVFGFLWMSLIWKKPYRKHMYGQEEGNSTNPDKRAVIQSFVLYILVSFMTSFSYAIVLNLGRKLDFGFMDASFITLLIWAGFTLPFAIGKKTWQFKSWYVVAIDASYEFIRFGSFLVVFWFWQ